MTRREVIVKAIEGRISWIQAASVLGISAREMARLRREYERFGFGGFRCGPGRRHRERIPIGEIEKLCQLRRNQYPDASVRQFYETATAKHGIRVSYLSLRVLLQAAGLSSNDPPEPGQRAGNGR